MQQHAIGESHFRGETPRVGEQRMHSTLAIRTSREGVPKLLLPKTVALRHISHANSERYRHALPIDQSADFREVKCVLCHDCADFPGFVGSLLDWEKRAKG